MAGPKSPWGGDKSGDETPAEGANTGAPGDGDTPAGETPKGPRNPWLPGGGATPPRRAASMEDILRSRGNRGGGGGPNFPRLPERADGKSWAGPIILEPVPEGVRVVPVLLDYGAEAADIAWIGTEHGVANFLRILARRRAVGVTVRFLAALEGEALADRKAMAGAARGALLGAMARQ